ncbi:MAG: sodium:solute symporter [Prevotella sp.]|nr:sodium:solute symporter [Prevotella sp.]
MTLIAIVLTYFAALFAISRWSARRGADNDTFFRAGRRSPWPLVAFGMVGASISGVTFVSVPGMVLSSQMTYLQVCLGFILGYLAVAFVLLPVYYKLNLTSIYAYLVQRLGTEAYKTGAWFFLLSKMVGAAIKFYVVCIILQQFVLAAWGVPFWLTVTVMVLLIWLYTRHGGVRTLVFTDTFQTLCLFTALILIIYIVMQQLGYSVGEAVHAVAEDTRSRIFVMDDWTSPQYFWKQILSGAFIVVVMTGLDQDMMQKNLTCRTLREAQKDMCSYGLAFLPANLLFLSLGILLAQLFEAQGTPLPSYGDELLPMFVNGTQHLTTITQHLFVIGIVASSFSSADSALTSLTTSYCVDIREKADDERLRRRVHLLICLLFVLVIVAFDMLNNRSLIDAIYTIVGYTYGPLLGLFAFGLFTRWQVRGRWVPLVCVLSPLLCYVISTLSEQLWDYHFGYELLLLNGLLTFVGLRIVSSTITNIGS